MLSNHKLPYVGRFACGWHRLSTTDPHAARGESTAAGANQPRQPGPAEIYCPGTLEPAEPEGLLALAGVAPSSTVTFEIFQAEPTLDR